MVVLCGREAAFSNLMIKYQCFNGTLSLGDGLHKCFSNFPPLLLSLSDIGRLEWAAVETLPPSNWNRSGKKFSLGNRPYKEYSESEE